MENFPSAEDAPANGSARAYNTCWVALSSREGKQKKSLDGASTAHKCVTPSQGHDNLHSLLMVSGNSEDVKLGVNVHQVRSANSFRVKEEKADVLSKLARPDEWKMPKWQTSENHAQGIHETDQEKRKTLPCGSLESISQSQPCFISLDNRDSNDRSENIVRTNNSDKSIDQADSQESTSMNVDGKIVTEFSLSTFETKDSKGNIVPVHLKFLWEVKMTDFIEKGGKSLRPEASLIKKMEEIVEAAKESYASQVTVENLKSIGSDEQQADLTQISSKDNKLVLSKGVSLTAHEKHFESVDRRPSTSIYKESKIPFPKRPATPIIINKLNRSAVGAFKKSLKRAVTSPGARCTSFNVPWSPIAASRTKTLGETSGTPVESQYQGNIFNKRRTSICRANDRNLWR